MWSAWLERSLAREARPGTPSAGPAPERGAALRGRAAVHSHAARADRGARSGSARPSIRRATSTAASCKARLSQGLDRLPTRRAANRGASAAARAARAAPRVPRRRAAVRGIGARDVAHVRGRRRGAPLDRPAAQPGRHPAPPSDQRPGVARRCSAWLACAPLLQDRQQLGRRRGQVNTARVRGSDRLGRYAVQRGAVRRSRMRHAAARCLRRRQPTRAAPLSGPRLKSSPEHRDLVAEQPFLTGTTSGRQPARACQRSAIRSSAGAARAPANHATRLAGGDDDTAARARSRSHSSCMLRSMPTPFDSTGKAVVLGCRRELGAACEQIQLVAGVDEANPQVWPQSGLPCLTRGDRQLRLGWRRPTDVLHARVARQPNGHDRDALHRRVQRARSPMVCSSCWPSLMPAHNTTWQLTRIPSRARRSSCGRIGGA